MSAEIMKLLRKTPIFSTLDSNSLKRIWEFFKERTYSSDEVLFREGTLGDTLYIIKEGAIKITRSAKEGEEESSRTLRREGDIFGESGFIDESPRPATAQAVKATKVFQLSRSDFLTILNNHPLVAYQIVKVLSSRIKQSDLRSIEELKEKNEQLQQAIIALQERSKVKESVEWSKESAVSKDEKGNFAEEILNSVPYPLICTAKDGLISFFNTAAEKEFGSTSQEAMGKPIEMLWSDTSWSGLYQDIVDKLAEKNCWEGEIIAKKKDDKHFLSFTTITEMAGAGAPHNGRLYLCCNVTQRRIREKEERKKEESALRQQVAEDIGNSISKEVKKLSEVFATLPAELTGADAGKWQNKINVMKNALDNIAAVISELDTSHSLELSLEPLDLESFFQEELLLLESQKRFKNISFVTQFEESAPKVNANRRQLRQMLFAILDNAASALQPVSDRARTITIEVGNTGQKDEVQIQISDNGMGISASDLSKIFKERFTTKAEGLGLGLLSVAKIVESHGGDIEVYSDEGTYTLFVIKFPACKEEMTTQSQREPALKS
jgi:CRP/FNR family transcriptional regulator